MDDIKKKVIIAAMIMLLPIFILFIYAPVFSAGLILGFIIGIMIFSYVICNKFEREGERMFDDLIKDLKKLQKEKNNG